jgi:formate C-acetyltransferase
MNRVASGVHLTEHIRFGACDPGAGRQDDEVVNMTNGGQGTIGLSPRVARLRDGIMARNGSFLQDFNPYLRDVALWRAMAPGRSRVQIRAALLREVVAAAPIAVPPDWTLAGEHLHSRKMWTGFGFGRKDTSDAADCLAALGIEAGGVQAVADAVQSWTTGNAIPTDIGCAGSHSPAVAAAWGNGDGVLSASGWVENHSVRDFAKVLRIGFGGIRAEVDALLRAADPGDPGFPQKENFWLAARDVCDAGILLGRRYADAAAALAREASDGEERSRLHRMVETCGRVPGEGARTFFEAVQSLWFAHILTCGEDGINANSIGRLDRILWPYYEEDRKAGRLTRDEAVELMQEYACKMYLDYDVQAIVLGGVDAAGREASSDLTGVILDATEDVGFVRDLSVRVGRATPKAVIRRAAELIVRGGGIPFLFNDDCFVPAVAEHGVAIEDARDYAPIGCIELTIPGKANPHAVSGWFNAAKCLELALFDGVDPRSGRAIGVRTGLLTDHVDFESFYRAYTQQVDRLARLMVYHCNRGELAQRERGPLPCWSVLTDDCIARGRDITNGGAKYNYHSVCFMGAANVADSLASLKKLVFEEKKVAPATLLEALRANYEGHDALRLLLLKGVPKYGNDVEEVDGLAARVCNEFIDLMDAQRSPLDGRYVVHLFTWRLNIEFGKAVGATPDGRRAGEPLAYSLSAHQGRDFEGVTAMLRSLSKLPHRRAGGASAAIVDLDSGFVAGESGVNTVAHLIASAIHLGVGQLQFNVTSVERLRQAQADPERYGNIPVRVAGYSQMFRLLSPELQEHIIARTKHRA